MAFEELSKNAEELLNDVLEHRFENGVCDFNYWQKQLRERDFAESMRLRSLFKELIDAGMIIIQWGDNFPYYMAMTDKGLSYANTKAEYIKKQQYLSRQKWMIGIIGAIIGAIISNLPDVFYLIKFVLGIK